MDACARLFRKRSFGWNRRAANRLAQREARGVTSEFSALFQSFYNYPLCPPGRASEGPVVGNLRFPPRGPSLQPPPESPFPFRVERLPVRPVSSCSNKSFAFGTLGLVGTGSHGGAIQTKRFVFTLPAVPPGRGLGVSQVVPAALRQSLRRRAGGRTKGNTLDLTSCRPPYGDGCMRPPVPKAKLWLEQAGSEQTGSARCTGGDSRPFPRPEGTRGESWKEGDKAEAVVPKGSGRGSVKREGLRACGGLPNKPWRRPTFPHKSMQYHGR